MLYAVTVIHLPDESLPYTFEEAKCSFGLCTFYGLHLANQYVKLFTKLQEHMLTTTPSTALAMLLARASPPAVTPYLVRLQYGELKRQTIAYIA